MRDTDTDRGIGLAGFRRYTWWAVPGSLAIVLLWFVGAWVVDPDVPVWARGSSAAALAVTVPASVILLSKRLALVPTETTETPTPPLPAAWLAAGSASATVLGVVPLAMRNYGLWAMTPAIMVSIAGTFLPPRRRRLLLATAMAVAPLPSSSG
jgi:two-component system sensor histidine kinase DesK